MVMFHYDDHYGNEPETWQVVKRADRLWALTITPDPGYDLGTFTTRHDAEAAKVDGFEVRQYWRDRAWYEGETPQGCNPFTPEVLARQRRARGVDHPASRH